MTAFFRSTLVLLLFFAMTTVAAQSESKVYITKTGERYHKSSCSYAKTGWQSTLAAAKKKGLIPCKVCKPGGAGSVSSTTSSNSLKSTNSATSSQCLAITKAGSRCSRKSAKGSSYCWQHEV
ncbi:hypothetical protein PBT90_02435 [Algoriphagus halophytocola]|uniref:hypothetical protein n=1 Tax=Algoriphagus halophytocola TaxID=2991499 RepID=UPI0022DE4D1C|nr:hypothetical protein [Algoriphagus sp. TR-M9]WBL43549.1 hypothetical protein PBT90_02435 [Algoriphagus sp. TR-M9]